MGKIQSRMLFMKYYEVVPLSYFGHNNDTLIYESVESLMAGQAVLIEVRNKKLAGIIKSETKKPSFKTKAILKSILDKPVLSPYLIKTADWIADYYISSLPSVYEAMLPVDLTKNRRIVEAFVPKIDRDKVPELTADQKKIVEAIIKDKSGKPHLIFGVTGSGKTEVSFTFNR